MTVTIPAGGGWVDTGVKVTPADLVTITAAGSWTPDGVNQAGPDGLPDSIVSADNYFNLADLGVCAVCATTKDPHWAMLISYTGNAPPGVGSYTSTAVRSQAMVIGGVGSHYHDPWPYPGKLWLGFNDDAYSGNTSDNSGQVTATITVKRS